LHPGELLQQQHHILFPQFISDVHVVVYGQCIGASIYIIILLRLLLWLTTAKEMRCYRFKSLWNCWLL